MFVKVREGTDVPFNILQRLYLHHKRGGIAQKLLAKINGS